LTDKTQLILRLKISNIFITYSFECYQQSIGDYFCAGVYLLNAAPI